MTTRSHVILFLSRAAGTATTFLGHYRGEHDGEAPVMVQLNEVHAPATNSSKYFGSHWAFIM